MSLGALVRGFVAGAVGTGAMTLSQRLTSSIASDASDERANRDPWEKAPAPAQVGKRVLEGIFGVQVPASKIPLLTHTMHWLYGIGWGGVYALVHETKLPRSARYGPLFGASLWGASYLELVPLGIYEPPWRYPLKTVAFDASYHVVYGSAVAAAYEAIDATGGR